MLSGVSHSFANCLPRSMNSLFLINTIPICTLFLCHLFSRSRSLPFILDRSLAWWIILRSTAYSDRSRSPSMIAQDHLRSEVRSLDREKRVGAGKRDGVWDLGGRCREVGSWVWTRPVSDWKVIVCSRETPVG